MIKTEFAIIGGGVAGALIARELAEAGRKVILFEAGPWIDRVLSVQRYKNSVRRDLYAPYPAQCQPEISKAHGPPHYLKAAGGTTWIWTGMTPRFLPEDFRMKSQFGIGQDWPISYQEMEPWYVAAENRLQVAGAHDFGSPRSAGYPLLPVPMSYADRMLASLLKPLGLKVYSAPAARATDAKANRPVCCGASTCSPICPTGAKYSADEDLRSAQRAGARIVTEATVHTLKLNEYGNIVAVGFRRPDGVTHWVAASYVVLYANAIETPRLMLANGLCPKCKVLGRGFMDHLFFLVEFQSPLPLYAGRGPQTIAFIDRGRSGKFRSRHAAAKLFLNNNLNIQHQANRLLADHKAWPRLLSKLRKQAIHWGAIGGKIEVL